MRSCVVGLAVAAATLASAGTSLAASVTVTSAVARDDQVLVKGTVDFPSPGRQSVTKDATFAAGAVANTPAGDSAGLKLSDAFIEPRPDGLRFTWKVDSLPAQIPPEGVRYTWGFQLGDRVYQLQAKRTNLVSLTTVEDPVGHIQRAAAQQSFFQLRGACQDSYQGTPVAGCYHLAFLDGGFDIAGGQIWVDLPYEARDPLGRVVIPGFRPGATLVDNAGSGTAGMTISAAFQAAISNTNLARYFTEVAPYHAGLSVDLAIAKPGGDSQTFTTTVVPAADGSFSAVVPGLTAADRTLRARACYGLNCVGTVTTVP